VKGHGNSWVRREDLLYLGLWFTRECNCGSSTSLLEEVFSWGDLEVDVDMDAAVLEDFGE
jgi:hypothetical protein